MTEFIMQRDKIRGFLVSKNLMSELARRAKVGRRTVDYTFTKDSLEKIKGKQLQVWNEALTMVAEITSMEKRIREMSNQI